MYIGMDYNQILIGVIAALSFRFLMVAMNFIAFQNSSGNRAFTILRTIQRETVIHIFYRSVQFHTPHELMQHMHIQAKVFMDFRSALWRIGILATGLLLTHSLHGLYPAMGAMLLVTALSTLLMPKVQGHQHTRERVPLTVLLKNRELVLILVITFLAHIGHQFNLAFFSKYLGDLGIGNTVTGVITTLAVALEIPFLLVGDRLMKRLSIWRWMTVGLMLGAVRFSLLAVVKAPALIVLAQTLSIAHLACFEFFPMVYLGRSVGENLQASCQSVLQMVSFGFARIIASLVGGLLADATGIPGVYGICGALMLATSLALFIPLERRARADKEQGVL